ncbi:hypothetical protein QTP88_028696 [Uroleucon formosanum]
MEYGYTIKKYKSVLNLTLLMIILFNGIICGKDNEHIELCSHRAAVSEEGGLELDETLFNPSESKWRQQHHRLQFFDSAITSIDRNKKKNPSRSTRKNQIRFTYH